MMAVTTDPDRGVVTTSDWGIEQLALVGQFFEAVWLVLVSDLRSLVSRSLLVIA